MHIFDMKNELSLFYLKKKTHLLVFLYHFERKVSQLNILEREYISF